MKKKTVFLIIYFFSICLLFADQTIVIGREDNWNGIQNLNNLTKEPGYQGFNDLFLDSYQYPTGQNTDLLLHFDSSCIDSSQNYTLTSPPLFNDGNSIIGSGSCLFSINSEGLEYQTGPNSLFNPESTPGDFSIEFWMYPAQTRDGENIFYWKGLEQISNKVIPQEIWCGIENRRLIWIFKNFFIDQERNLDINIELSAITPLIPRTWNHHSLVFDSETGKIIYSVNGVPEAITYACPEGQESSTIYQPFIGNSSNSQIIIGKDFQGLLDEFRITKNSSPSFNITRTYYPQGTVQTELLDLGQTNSRIKEINLDAKIPEGTEIYSFYKTADTLSEFYQSDLPFIEFDWKNPQSIEFYGRYFKLYLEFLSDGTLTKTPVLHSINISYEIDLPPDPPLFLQAIPGDKEITIQWNPVNAVDLQGYLLYFGTKPGNYNGTTDQGISSPIDVGNLTSYTLSGLENRQIYYFSIVSYDYADNRHFSNFSSELNSRPRRQLP